jgi:putative oxidoreductase
MNVRKVVTMGFLSPLAPLGWAIVRFAGGALLVPHGWLKVTEGGVEKLRDMLATKGVPLPEVSAWLSAGTELVGGALLALGLFTRPAAFAIAINMAVAILLAHVGDLPKIGTPEGGAVEYPILLFAVAFGALLHGGGLLSLDAAIFRDHRRPVRLEPRPPR